MQPIRTILTWPARFMICLIRIYQKWVSPWLPPGCRFTPSCSEYTIQAVLKYGLLKGLLLGILRVSRCQPFCKSGYDPV